MSATDFAVQPVAQATSNDPSSGRNEERNRFKFVIFDMEYVLWLGVIPKIWFLLL